MPNPVSGHFDAAQWNGLIADSAPKSSKAPHPYICLGVLGNFFLSNNKNSKEKLALRNICKITQQHLKDLKSEGEEIRSGLLKIQQSSSSKLKGRIFFMRVLVKVLQSIRNAFAGLGFKTNVTLLEKLCRDIPSVPSLRPHVEKPELNDSKENQSIPALAEQDKTVEKNPESGKADRILFIETSKENKKVDSHNLDQKNRVNPATDVERESSHKQKLNEDTAPLQKPVVEKNPDKEKENKNAASHNVEHKNQSDAATNVEKESSPQQKPNEDAAIAAELKVKKIQEFQRKYREAIHRNRDVKPIIKEALGKSEQECCFDGIAEEITLCDIMMAVHDRDLFDLGESAPLGYDPLTGFFKALSSQKLENFLWRILMEMTGKVVISGRDLKIDFDFELFKRLLHLIDQCEEPKKRELFVEVASHVMKEKKLQDWLPELSKDCAGHVSFARHYLAMAFNDEQDFDYHLKKLYRKNVDLFAAALIHDGHSPLVSDQGLAKIRSWYEKLKADEPKPLSSVEEKDIIKIFYAICKDPLKVKAFLNIEHENDTPEFKKRLKKIINEMKEDEVSHYADEYYNCFGIKASSDPRLIDFLFECFEDFKLLQEFVEVTSGRSDLGNKTFVALMLDANQRKTLSERETLFNGILDNTEGRLGSFFKDLSKYNDGLGEAGPFMSAVIGFLSAYLKKDLEARPHDRKDERLVIMKETLLKLDANFTFSRYPELNIS